MRGVFFCVSAFSGVSALLIGLLVRGDRALDAVVEGFSPTSVLANVASDLRDILRLRSVRGALLVLFCAQLGSSAISAQIELFVRDVWAGAPENLNEFTGIAVSAFAAASLVAMPAWGHFGDRLGHARALRWCALTGTAALGLHAFVSSYVPLVAVRVALGLTIGGASAVSFGIVATESPVERRGSAIGAAFSARAFAMSFGSMAGGVAAAALGLRGLFIGSAVLALTGTLLALAWIDRLPQDAVGLDA